MKNKKWLIVIGVVLLVGILCILIYSKKNKAISDEVTRIGAILPLTGDYADVGQWMKAGILLALEDCNTNSENRIEVLFEDSQGKANGGLNAYRKLRDVNQVNFFISTVTPVCLALRPQVMADGNFMLVNAGHKDITSIDAPTIFRHALTMTQEAKFLAKHVQENHVIKADTQYCFVYANNDIGLEVRDVFLTNMPPCEVSVFSYEESDKDLKNVSAKIVSSNPEFIVICGYTKNLGILIKTIRENGCTERIYVNQGFSTPSVRETAGKFAYNVFYTDYDIPNSVGIQKLREKVQAEFSTSLSTHNITAYNAMVLIYHSIANCREEGISPINVANTLKAGSPYFVNEMRLDINEIGDIYVPLIMVENKWSE